MQIEQFPTCQPLTHRRDNLLTNQSSQEELQQLLSAITQWRLRYDPSNELFPEIWDQENQKFKSQLHSSNTIEYKEEEPSPQHFQSNTEIHGKFSTCDSTSNKYDVITSDISETQAHGEESDDPDFDPMADTETWNEMKKINQQNLNKTKAMRGLNKKAKEFIPSSQKRLPDIDELTILDNPKTKCTNTVTAQQTQQAQVNSIKTPKSANISTQVCAPIPFNQYIMPNTTIVNALNINMAPATFIVPSFPNVNLNAHINANILPNTVTVQPVNHINVSDQAKTVNQFDTVHSQVTQHKSGTIKTECKYNERSRNNNIVKDMDDEIFEPKFNNHAKGNFFIEKHMTAKMMQKCKEKFNTFRLNDDNAAFGYYKESVAMQINDKQIRVIKTRKGEIVILNIDLHFENGDIMYLIGMENDFGYKKQVKWKIVEFMSAYEIKCVYNINKNKLPRSSRNMPRFRCAIKNPPMNVPLNVIEETDFKNLPCKDPNKQSKRNKMRNGGLIFPRIRISENDLKKYCRQSWNNSLMVPVVVVKGKKQWIEWKKFIRIYDRCNNKYEWIGISLRYYPSNRQWKIECMDYDFGRIFYQHRLVGTNHGYCYKYNDLKGYVTTSLDIY